MNDEKEPPGVQQEATESGRSLANIRHTLRTPLNHIIGYSEMLLEEADERGLESSIDDIRKIHAAGKRLLACIDELLDPETIDKASAQGSGGATTIGLFREADGDALSATIGADSSSKSGRILIVDDGACLEEKRLRDQEVSYLNDVVRVTSAAAAIATAGFRAEMLVDVVKRPDELGQLARVFERMAGEVAAREEQLKQQIQVLRIEIDQAKKAQQVCEITDTE